jgi:hypothetical protein
MIRKYLLPFHGLSFDSVDSVPQCTEVIYLLVMLTVSFSVSASRLQAPQGQAHVYFVPIAISTLLPSTEPGISWNLNNYRLNRQIYEWTALVCTATVNET